MIDGLVYYALDATNADVQVKIGFTTDLRGRMSGLRVHTASHQVPIVLAVEAGSLQLERQRHEEFAEFRMTGEWFRYADRLVAHVAALDDPYEYLKARPELLQFAGGWRSLSPAPQVEGVAFETPDDLDQALREIAEIADPLIRARAAQRFIEGIQADIKEAQQGRDEAIRETRDLTANTIDEIAQYIGAKRNVVVDALRGRRERS
jgi:hypothetical protein